MQLKNVCNEFNKPIMKNEYNMMYDVQFGAKNYQNINSPFIHPEESIRPLPEQPSAYNNTLETELPNGGHASNFLENVPSNIFSQNYFNTNQSYESPYLANINKIQSYDNSIGALVAPNKNDYSNTNFQY